MSDHPKVSNDISSSSVDSLNTNSQSSSKTSASTNDTVNSIKYQGKFNYLQTLCNDWSWDIVADGIYSISSKWIWLITAFSSFRN